MMVTSKTNGGNDGPRRSMIGAGGMAAMGRECQLTSTLKDGMLQGGECQLRALTVNSFFVLRALAAQELLQVLNYGRCSAAAKPVVRAFSRTNTLGLGQVLDKAD